MGLTITSGKKFYASSAYGQLAEIEISNGGQFYNGVLNSGAICDVLKNGIANSTKIDGGRMNIHSGGSAISLDVSNNGYVYASGGLITNLTIETNGNVHVISGNKVKTSLVRENGTMYVSTGGVVSETRIEDGGSVNIGIGGIAENTVINSGGSMTIDYAGNADNTTINPNGKLYVSSGGSAAIAFNPWQGTVTSEQGAIITNLERDADIYYGNTTAGTIAKYQSTVTSFTVNSGNSAIIYDGGIVNDSTIESGGMMIIDSGGILSGKIDIESNGSIQAREGSIIELNIADHSPNRDFLINDLSRISGSYKLLLASKLQQSYGIYKLAGNLNSLNCDISISYDENKTADMELNQELYIGNISYFLNVADNNLYLTISGADTLIAPTVMVSTTELTNKDVIVSAVFAGNSILNEFSYDGENFEEYTTAITVKENTDIIFRSKKIFDGEEIFNSTTVSVNNIDKDKPTCIVTLSETLPTNNDVTLTAKFSADAVVKQYSFDGKNYVDYTKAITLKSNATIYFYCIDKAGNFSDVLKFAVTNIVAYDHVKLPDDSGQAIMVSANNFKDYFEISQMGEELNFYVGKDSYSYKGSDNKINKIKIYKGSSVNNFYQATTNEVADIFFARANGVWGSLMRAEYQGSADVEAEVVLKGKNKICDIFVGSSDSNILFLTNDSNGDALFIDDIYSASFDNFGESNSRLAQIKEIQAGDGDDIIDLTSNKFDYSGSEMTIYGGSGNDIIWANDSVDNVIHGGFGDDTLVGGSQKNTFVFEANWGNDVIYYNGTVTLNFIGVEEGKLITSDNTISYNGNSVTLINPENQYYSITCSQLA